jgi:ABC-2 type transport system ATP-binding protein
MTQPLVTAVGVTRRFGHFTAVDSVTMDVRPGEVVGLLGANGAGKTTLIRLLLGLLAPDAGHTTLMGGVPDRESRAKVGYVPQGLGLYADLTVSENLAFMAGAYGAAPAPLPAELEDLSDALVGTLPLGAQRRLAFACALQHEPPLLLLDEPTSGVEPLARAALWDTVHEQAEKGVGVLVTTHYMQEAQQCDRLILMSDARLVGSGSEQDVIGDTTAVEVVCDDWAGAFAALEEASQPVTLAGRSVRVADGDPDEVKRIIEDAGVDPVVRRVPATLEERMAVLARAAAERAARSS